MTMRSSCNIHAGVRRIARPQGGRQASAYGKVDAYKLKKNTKNIIDKTAGNQRLTIVCEKVCVQINVDA